MSEYEAQANEFCERFGITIKAAFKGDRCPKWETDNKHIHGDRYRVTIKKRDTGVHMRIDDRGDEVVDTGPHFKSISFDFWNSYNDSHNGKTPTNYDILACVSSECFNPTDPDEVVAEFGEMKPSRAIAIAKHAAKLQAFFTEAEQEALAEIR